MSETAITKQAEAAAQPLRMAEITEIDTMGMPPTSRCDRCGAQAYVQAEVAKMELLFCVHHYVANADAIIQQATRIFDHRKFLDKQEQTQPV